MALTQEDIDAAVARLLSKGQKHSIETDGLSSAKEELSVKDLMRLQAELNISSGTGSAVRYQRFKPASGGAD